MSETDDRKSLEILQAPLVRHDESESERYRLMGFAVALALLVLLTPPWLTEWSNSGKSARTTIYSGIDIFNESPLDGLGVFLFLVYLLAAVGILLYPATIVAVVGSLAGVVATLVVMVTSPTTWEIGPSDSYYLDTTGTPIVAVGIWVISGVVALIGWSASRPRR